jgi:hypothetical protein
MITQDQRDAIDELAEMFEASIREDYSGRFMYGDTCYGIVFDDDADTVINQAIILGLTGSRIDNMGLSTIVYWPHISN